MKVVRNIILFVQISYVKLIKPQREMQKQPCTQGPGALPPVCVGGKDADLARDPFHFTFGRKHGRPIFLLNFGKKSTRVGTLNPGDSIKIH